MVMYAGLLGKENFFYWHVKVAMDVSSNDTTKTMAALIDALFGQWAVILFVDILSMAKLSQCGQSSSSLPQLYSLSPSKILNPHCCLHNIHGSKFHHNIDFPRSSTRSNSSSESVLSSKSQQFQFHNNDHTWTAGRFTRLRLGDTKLVNAVSQMTPIEWHDGIDWSTGSGRRKHVQKRIYETVIRKVLQ